MPEVGGQIEAAKRAAARVAATLVRDGQVVGLGSGTTMHHVIAALDERVRGGLRVVGVPTSEQTAVLAREAGITLADLVEVSAIDLTLDGADEIDPRLGLIKGRGGALVREKVVAAASQHLVIVADETKLVPALGTRTAVPVAAIPFGWRHVRDAIHGLGGRPELRRVDGEPYLTDDGLYVLDCRFGVIADPERLAEELRSIVGLVEHGLFLGMAERAVIGGLNGRVWTVECP